MAGTPQSSQAEGTTPKAAPPSLEKLFERTSEVAGVGGWTYDCLAETLWWSDVTCAIHEEPPGFEPDLRRALDYYLPGEDAESIKRSFGRAVKEGVPFDLELRIRTAKGRLRRVRAVGHPEWDQGRTTLVSGAFQDITEQVETRQALKRQSDFNRAYLQSNPFGFCAFDRAGALVDVNRAMCLITGFTREELLGDGPPHSLFSGGVFDAIPQDTGERSGKSEELELIHKEGRTVWVEWTRSVVPDPATGEETHCAFVRDITRRKKAEEALGTIQQNAGRCF